MKGRNGTNLPCPVCQKPITRSGRFCPYCGARRPSSLPVAEAKLPKYWKRERRLVTRARCGPFHHELLLRLFSFRFCPECGRQLGIGPCQPQPT
ncbi:MAG: hypothetical protein ABIK44_00720 [candidate division WOR-3 bacterium]